MTKEEQKKFEQSLVDLIEMNAECNRLVEKSNLQIQKIIFQLSDAVLVDIPESFDVMK